MLDQVETRSQRLPIVIVTGFLGAGKTSFISQLLKMEGMSKSAVIINEFGEVGLDHILVDSLNEQIIDLPNGCLCCNSSSALVEKLLSLWSENVTGEIDIDRVIIETSGISDTTNLIQFLWDNSQVRESFQLAKIITIVSAIEWNDSKSNFLEVERQLAICDAVIITKSDLLPQKSKDVKLAHLLTEIEMISPDSSKNLMPLSFLQTKEIFERDNNTFVPAISKGGLDHNTNTYKTCALNFQQPISIEVISLFLNIITTRYGDNLLRIKGLILTKEMPLKPMIIQVVKSTITPYSWLEKWPQSPQTQIIMIHTYQNDLPLIDLFNSVTNSPAIDQPDRLALSDNPLSITGQGKYELK